MTNDQIIEALKPTLNAILEIECSYHVNEVRVTLHRTRGEYLVKVDAWCHSSRITSPDLASLPQAVKDFDPAAKAREEKLAEIERLKKPKWPRLKRKPNNQS